MTVFEIVKVIGITTTVYIERVCDDGSRDGLYLNTALELIKHQDTHKDLLNAQVTVIYNDRYPAISERGITIEIE